MASMTQELRLKIHLGILVLTAAPVLLPVKLSASTACAVAQHSPPADAGTALLAADYVKTATLYQAALAAHAGDATLTAGLVNALLRQQKVPQAADAGKAAFAAAANAPILISLRGVIKPRHEQAIRPPEQDPRFYNCSKISRNS